MHYSVLYPQNGDRIVTTDSVTSRHRIYIHAVSDSQDNCTSLYWASHLGSQHDAGGHGAGSSYRSIPAARARAAANQLHVAVD